MYTESTGNVNGNTTRIGESECEAIGSFFASILPDEGRRCIAALSPDEPGMRHYWFEDNESAAAKALDLDRAGYNVFFGCAAYKDASSRAQSNVQSVKAFWLDVDAGEGKPYADLKTAAEAFTAARGKLALPGPVAVRSGNGLHLYFRMPEAIPPATWQRIARKLKLAIAHAGLEADPARTCDHASVLRVPYTHNRKSVPRPVGVVGKSLSDAKVVPYAELEATLDQYIADNGLAAIEQKPADNLNADLMGGMQDSWFDRLSAADKDPCLAEILQQPAIAALALTKDSDPDPNWRTVIAACRRSGAANSEELCRAWAQRGNYTEDHFNSSWRYYGKPVKDGQPAIGIGTLIQLARQGGWDPAVWKRKTGGTLAVTGAGGAAPISPGVQRCALSELSGSLPEATAVASINRHFGYAHVWGQEGSYFRIETDGRAVPIQKKDVEQSCANLSVEVTTKEGAKYVNAFKHWNSAADKLIFDRVVYDPEGKRVNSNERTLNLWRGLSRKARRGNWARMRRHLRDVICDGDTKAFRYLLQWFAHAMQHPGTAPGTVIVMKSEREGTGKSSTCSWLTRIFGEHGAEFNSAEQLLGKHNAHLETLSCIVVNEPTFAGDKAANRKLKSMISDAWWTIEPKFRGVYRVPNIAHMMFTTNEPWAVAAGAGARRYLVLEVSPAKAGDASYFAKLNHEVDHGGLEAFLHFLLRLDIRGFDPRRDLPKTAALAEQQILSAPLHVQWALELAERGRTGQGQFGFATGNPITFGADAATADLHRDYLDFAKGRFGVPLSLRAFGKYLAGIGLQQRQLGKQRHKGFSMPHPDQFEALVKAERKIEG